MEVSALKLSGGVGLHGRSPLLRVQSDERLVALIRRGNDGAFEVLVSRYESRLLSFCRHMVGTREDAEDVLQEVMAAAYNALKADERAINVRPWLYRIARNRSLNHLRKTTAVGVDSMDIHFSDHGASTADKAGQREEFRLLVGDIQGLPETQRTALVLREMDALSYDQIAEAMETTVPSVKSLLVRARMGLAEAAEARALSCDEVRDELGEIAEGLKRKMSPAVRRHVKECKRCDAFRVQLKETNKALAALLPLGPLVLLKKFALTQIGHHSSAAAGGSVAGGAAASGGAAAGGGAIVTSSGLVSAGVGAIATKAAAGFAAAALVTAGAVAVDQKPRHRGHHFTSAAVLHASQSPTSTAVAATPAPAASVGATQPSSTISASANRTARPGAAANSHRGQSPQHTKPASTTSTSTTATVSTVTSAINAGPSSTTPTTATDPTPAPGRTQTQTVPTVLPPPPTSTTPTTGTGTTTTGGDTTEPTLTVGTAPAPPAPPTSTTPAPPPTSPDPAPTTPPADPTPTTPPADPTPTDPTPTTPAPAPATASRSSSAIVDHNVGSASEARERRRR